MSGKTYLEQRTRLAAHIVERAINLPESKLIRKPRSGHADLSAKQLRLELPGCVLDFLCGLIYVRISVIAQPDKSVTGVDKKQNIISQFKSSLFLSFLSKHRKELGFPVVHKHVSPWTKAQIHVTAFLNTVYEWRSQIEVFLPATIGTVVGLLIMTLLRYRAAKLVTNATQPRKGIEQDIPRTTSNVNTSRVVDVVSDNDPLLDERLISKEPLAVFEPTSIPFQPVRTATAHTSNRYPSLTATTLTNTRQLYGTEIPTADSNLYRNIMNDIV